MRGGRESLLLNGRTVVTSVEAHCHSLSAPELAWIYAAIPAYHADMNLVLAGTKSHNPLAAIAWAPLSAPDSDWLEVHVAARPRTGLASGFRAILDTFCWLPNRHGHAGLVADVRASHYDVISLLCRIGFMPIRASANDARPRILFQRVATALPRVDRLAHPYPHRLWQIPADHSISRQGDPPDQLLSSGDAAFWCRHEDALLDLGLPGNTTAAQLQRGAEKSPAHEFRSHRGALGTLWSLCSNSADLEVNHVLVMDWKKCLRTPTALQVLAQTVRAVVGQEDAVRHPSATAPPREILPALALRCSGLSPSGRSIVMHRTESHWSACGAILERGGMDSKGSTFTLAT